MSPPRGPEPRTRPNHAATDEAAGPLGKDFSDYLEFLAAFSARLAEMPDSDTTLDTALQDIAKFVDVEAGAVFLREEGEDGLVCRASVGPAEYRGARSGPGEGILARCIADNAVHAVEAPVSASEFPQVGGAADFSVRSVLCAPMGLGEECFGALALVNKRDGGFGQGDRHFLQAVAGSTAFALANLRLAEMKAEQERVAGELELAAEIQRNLLPQVQPGEYPVVGINLPIREVSGDFYDFWRLPNGDISFAIGDVSGKGMNAALLMAKTASLFHCLAKSIDDPAALLKIINREIHETTIHGMFVTMVAGVYEPRSSRIRFANAGHEPPLLRGTDHSYRTYPADAPPLGVLPDLAIATQTTEIGSGQFYIFTDGLTEYRYDKKEYLGIEGLIQLVEASTEVTLEARLVSLLSDLEEGGWEQRDDLTVLAIDGAWTAPDGQHPPARPRQSDGAPDTLLELRLPARSDRLKLIRPGVQAAAAMCGFEREAAEDIVLAVHEACQNVIVHAYGDDQDGEIVLEIYRREDGILIRVRDFAPPIDVATVRPRDLDDIRPGGLGTHFIREIMDTTEFIEVAEGAGNVLEMTKKLR